MIEEGFDEARALVLQRVLSEDFYWSPRKFVMWAYPWGEGRLKKHKGPRKWQCEVLDDIEVYLVGAYKNRNLSGDGEPVWGDFLREAIASGRGPGKSALLGMLGHWFMSTRIGSSTWVTANGEPQLRTKTFPEIAKWVSLAINGDFFDINSTTIVPSKWFKEYIESPEGLGKSARYYYISGQLWSTENPDAFAGAHNDDGEMSLFDEASGIPDVIWDVQEGVFTEDIPDRFWFAFSNPRRSIGTFFECFDNPLWKSRNINSLDVEGINKTTFHNIINKHGKYSDAANIEVYGQFPTDGENVFKQAWLKYGPEPEYGDYYIAIDLAGFEEVKDDSKKAWLDDSAIAVVKVTQDGKWWVKKIEHGRWDVRECAVRIIKAIKDHRPMCVGIENGALKRAVMPYLTDLMRKHNVNVHIEPLQAGKNSKASRVIYAIQGMFEHGRIVLNEKEDWKKFIHQYLMFPNKKAHDDLMDALAYISHLSVTTYMTAEESGDNGQDWKPVDLVAGI